VSKLPQLRLSSELVKKLFGHRCTRMNTDENKCFICMHQCASVAICDFFTASHGRGSVWGVCLIPSRDSSGSGLRGVTLRVLTVPHLPLPVSSPSPPAGLPWPCGSRTHFDVRQGVELLNEHLRHGWRKRDVREPENSESCVRDRVPVVYGATAVPKRNGLLKYSKRARPSLWATRSPAEKHHALATNLPDSGSA
jgi:hypothetical protein